MEGEFFVCWFGFVFWPGSGGAGKGRISFLFGTGIFWGRGFGFGFLPYGKIKLDPKDMHVIKWISL